MAKKNIGKWIDVLANSVGKFVHLETRDGLARSGRLTGYRTTDIKLNGEEVPIIIELELNGDPTDSLPITQLSSIEVDQ